MKKDRDENVEQMKTNQTFVEVLDARIVERLCDDVLQAVFAARAAGVHFHVAEAQFLQVTAQRVRDHHPEFTADIFQTNRNSLMDTDLTDQGSCGGLPDPRGSREQSRLVS